MKFHHSNLLFALAFCGLAFAQDRPVRFRSEVTSGEDFRLGIGRGLVFAVKASTGGWTLDIERAGPGKCPISFARVVATPIRWRTALDLTTDYGVAARDALPKDGKVEFPFVLTDDDCNRESERLSRLLWSYSYTEKEADDALANFGSTAAGHATVRILASKVVAAGELLEGKDLGQIDWMKFEVTIAFPPKR